MTRGELHEKLDLLGINHSRYSLYGDLKPDSVVLFQNHESWEVFYFDERGGRNEEQIFKSENEACLYIYRLFKDSKDMETKFGIKI